MTTTTPPTHDTAGVNIPTFPNFSLPPAAATSLLADIHDVELDHRPITIHQPFTAQVLHAMSTNIHFDILTTSNHSAFTTALPRLSDTCVEAAAAKFEEYIFAALRTYFSTTIAYNDRLLSTVWTSVLLKEVYDISISEFLYWKEDLEGVLIGDDKPLEGAVKKELRRVVNLLL